MKREDEIRLRHMRDASREARLFCSGRPRNDLDQDRMMALALLKEIEIIGEAMSRILRIDPDFRIENSRQITDTRNWVIHGYDKASYSTSAFEWICRNGAIGVERRA